MPDCFSEIETAPFADGALAHNVATGALCRLNRTAAEILAMMRNGRTEREAATAMAALYAIAEETALNDVTALVRGWRDSGLIGAAAGKAAPSDDTAPEPPRFTPALDIAVSCGGPGVRLTCEEEELSGLLAEVLAPAVVADSGDTTGPENAVVLCGREGDFRCRCAGRLLWRAGPRPIARRLILQEVMRRSLPDGPPAAILHASAVLMDGRAVILAGTSGSGKSTLTAGLVAAGARLIADDLLPLGRAGDGVLPVPFALSAKEGSWPVLEPLFAGFDRLRTLTSRGIRVRYLAPALAERGRPVAAGLVVFPRWDAEASANAQPVPGTAIADRLIATGTDLSRGGGGVEQFARFCGSVSGHAITYPDLHGGIEAVRALVAGL